MSIGVRFGPIILHIVRDFVSIARDVSQLDKSRYNLNRNEVLQIIGRVLSDRLCHFQGLAATVFVTDLRLIPGDSEISPCFNISPLNDHCCGRLCGVDVPFG